MKKNILLKAALSVATAFILMAMPACKKTSEPQPLTKTQLIASGNWKVLKFEQKNAAGTWVDITNTLPACEVDNILSFRTNLTYELNEGATKCNAGDPQVMETGTWKFENNETKVSFTETGNTIADVADIVELTGASLVFTKDFIENGNTYQFRVSYKH